MAWSCRNTIAAGTTGNTVNLWLWSPSLGRRKITLSGHNAGISAVTFSPDGSQLVTASHDHTIRIWDANSGMEMLCLRGHNASVHAVAFSPDGRYVISGSGDLQRGDRSLRLWDAATGSEIRRIEHSSPVLSVAFCRDGKRMVSAGSTPGYAQSCSAAFYLWHVFFGRESFDSREKQKMGSYGFENDHPQELTAETGVPWGLPESTADTSTVMPNPPPESTTPTDAEREHRLGIEPAGHGDGGVGAEDRPPLIPKDQAALTKTEEQAAKQRENRIVFTHEGYGEISMTCLNCGYEDFFERGQPRPNKCPQCGAPN